MKAIKYEVEICADGRTFDHKYFIKEIQIHELQYLCINKFGVFINSPAGIKSRMKTARNIESIEVRESEVRKLYEFVLDRDRAEVIQELIVKDHELDGRIS